MDITPRYATPADFPESAEIYWSVWHETHGEFMPQKERDRRTRAFFADRLSLFAPCMLVVEVDGKIAGFSAWQGHLVGQLFIKPEWRGRGIADALMLATEKELSESGVHNSELLCLVGNVRARKFYERLGWVVREETQEPVNETADWGTVPTWRMVKTLPHA